MKFLCITARKDGFRRSGVRHSGRPAYYPLEKIDPDEIKGYARKIEAMDGELRIFFEKHGKECNSFTTAELASIKAEPMLITLELEVMVEAEPSVKEPELSIDKGKKPVV